MKTDKNTVIGFILLGILLFLFFWVTNKQQRAALAEQQRKQDSIARLEAKKLKPADTAAQRLDSLQADSASLAGAAGGFAGAIRGAETETVIENELMRAVFSNRGGTLKGVELKKFTSFNDKPVLLGGTAADRIGYSVNTAPNQSATTSDLYFSPGTVSRQADGSQTLSYTLQSATGQSIVHQFTVRPNEYMIDWNIRISGVGQLLTSHTLNLQWQQLIKQQQKDISYERGQSRIAYVQDGDYDFEHVTEGAQVALESPTQWAAVKQQFFNQAIIAETPFSAGQVQLTARPDSTHELFAANANFQLKLPAAATASTRLRLYYGPTDYDILKKYNLELEDMVDLGSGIFAFVKYINRWIIMPVFDFFASFVANYGWVILLLTLFIRLVTAPLTYSSYLSGAKMKVLRPELDVLREKYGEDKQGYAMEQMKLFREAGVNPLGGCIPALLQIPIFFALYSFFNSHIDLRGQEFLWSADLSQYDSIATLPFSIPFGFGNHISLFTLTAVITSFLISVYNMSMTPDTGNPVMKYMPYVFPVILLFIFNKLPSALTWYYTVSNIITLVLQFVIQNYIINHDKILAKIEETRKKPRTKSKWQQRYEEMMESQKKLQEMKNKTQQRKK